MFLLLGGTLAVLMGFAARRVALASGFRESESINRLELVIGSVVCAAIVIPIVTMLGTGMARASTATYHEWWGGLEKTVTVETTRCSKDGSCTHEYDCDSYIVMVPTTKTETYRKPDGTTGTRTVRGPDRAETRWHSCPYVDAEYTFKVTDTLGETYTFGNHWFPANPSSRRWHGWGWNDTRWGNGLPGNVSSGQPTAWVAAKQRIDSGNPGGTTKRASYKNYILASSDDIYGKESNAIDGYVKAGQMPKVATSIHDQYAADKAYFVGPVPTGTKAADWQTALARFDGYLGKQRQGDLHLVIVNNPKIDDPDRYTQALEAYWQSPALGKDSLSKNGIGLVVGVGTNATGQPTVAWARGFTGMPEGNEALVQSFFDIKGSAATPDALLGRDTGAIWKTVLAPGAGFKRVHMADYDYLYETIKPSTGAMILILLVGLLVSALVWGALFAVDLVLPTAWTDAIREARLAKTASGGRA